MIVLDNELYCGRNIGFWLTILQCRVIGKIPEFSSANLISHPDIKKIDTHSLNMILKLRKCFWVWFNCKDFSFGKIMVNVQRIPTDICANINNRANILILHFL